jgi:hypothetical protein
VTYFEYINQMIYSICIYILLYLKIILFKYKIIFKAMKYLTCVGVVLHEDKSNESRHPVVEFNKPVNIVL